MKTHAAMVRRVGFPLSCEESRALIISTPMLAPPQQRCDETLRRIHLADRRHPNLPAINGDRSPAVQYPILHPDALALAHCQPPDREVQRCSAPGELELHLRKVQQMKKAMRQLLVRAPAAFRRWARHEGRRPTHCASAQVRPRPERRWESSIALAICGYVTLGGLLPLSAQAQEIIVGQTLSLTGPSTTIAQDLLRGRRACIEFINAQGGIRGRPFKLVTRDDRNDAVRAVQLARDLVEQENVAVMLGSMGPAVNASVLEWAGATGMAVVGPYGGDIEIRMHDSGTVFFLTANQSAEAARLASHIASLGLTRVVIVYATDKSGRAALTALEEALGVSNVAAVALVPVGPDASDVGAAARAVAKSNAQAVLLATSGRATVAMLKALTARSDGLRLLQVYGLSSAASQAELLELGTQARGFSMSQVMPLPRDSRLPVVATFQTAMRDFKGERTYAELEGCIGPLLLADVLRRNPVDLRRAGVLRAMKAAGRVNLGGFEIDLSDRVNPGSHFTDIVYVGSDGRILR